VDSLSNQYDSELVLELVEFLFLKIAGPDGSVWSLCSLRRRHSFSQDVQRIRYSVILIHATNVVYVVILLA